MESHGFLCDFPRLGSISVAFWACKEIPGMVSTNGKGHKWAVLGGRKKKEFLIEELSVARNHLTRAESIRAFARRSSANFLYFPSYLNVLFEVTRKSALPLEWSLGCSGPHRNGFRFNLVLPWTGGLHSAGCDHAADSCFFFFFLVLSMALLYLLRQNTNSFWWKCWSLYTLSGACHSSMPR